MDGEFEKDKKDEIVICNFFNSLCSSMQSIKDILEEKKKKLMIIKKRRSFLERILSLGRSVMSWLYML